MGRTQKSAKMPQFEVPFQELNHFGTVRCQFLMVILKSYFLSRQTLQ